MKGNNNKSRFTLDMTPELRTRLKIAAACKGVTMRQYSISAIEQQLDRERIEALGLRPVINPWDAQFHNQECIYDAIVLAVPHSVFRERRASEYVRLLRSRSGSRAVLVDVKGVLDREVVERARAVYWSL